MHSHPVRKGLVAAVTACALVLFLASPAPATEVTAGILTVRTTPNQVFELGPPGPGDPEPPCPEKTGTLAMTATPESPDNPGTPHQGTWSATGSWSGFFQLGNPPSGQWYQADFTILSANGTYTGANSPYALASSPPNHITVSVTIYTVSSGNCTKSLQNRVCVLAGRMVITSGTHTGGLTPVTGTTVFDATSNTTGGLPLAATSCQQPFSSMHGAHFDVDDLTFTH